MTTARDVEPGGSALWGILVASSTVACVCDMFSIFQLSLRPNEALPIALNLLPNESLSKILIHNL